MARPKISKKAVSKKKWSEQRTGAASAALSGDGVAAKAAKPAASKKPATSSARAITPTKSAPTKSAPTKSAPTKSAPTKSAPTKSAPTKSAPTKSAPKKAAAQPGLGAAPPGTRHWLMKSEPDVFSIQDLARDGATSWEGVRNFQARNYMKDAMELGDLVLFYHSNAEPSGVAGIAKVSRLAYADPSQWDPKSEYYDETAPREPPRWVMVEVAYVETFPSVITLDMLKNESALEGMWVTRKGNRLSITPVEAAHFEHVRQMGRR